MEEARLMTTIIASLLMTTACTQAVREGRCQFDQDEKGCFNALTLLVEDKILTEKKEFTIYYIKQGMQEIVAECDWVRSGSFQCEEAKGYTYNGTHLSIDTATRCLKSGHFKFDVFNAEDVLCNVSSFKFPTTSPDSYQEIPQGEDSPENFQHENGKDSLAIGLGLGIVAVVGVTVVAAALFVKRNRLQKCLHGMIVGTDSHIRSQDKTEVLSPLNPELPDESRSKEIQEPSDQENKKMVVVDLHAARCVTDKDLQCNNNPLNLAHVKTTPFCT